jgi:hypothetical protein
MADRQKEPIGAISPYLFRLAIETARDLDLNKGGLWDGRSGAINLWASPEDRPTGWPEEVEIRQMALAYPRAYVATFDMQWPSDSNLEWSSREASCQLLADIDCSEVAERYKEQYRRERSAILRQAAAERDEYITDELVDEANSYGIDKLVMNMSDERRAEIRRLEMYGRGRVTGDLEWVKAKWAELFAEVQKRVPAPLRMQLGGADGECPSCGSALRLVTRVLSSPFPDNSIGNWTHWCERCKAFTVTRAEMLAMADRPRDPKAIGHVIAYHP